MQVSSQAATGPISLLRKTVVLERTGLCHAALYRAIKDGRIAPPVKIGRSSRRPSTDVDAYIARTIAASRGAK